MGADGPVLLDSSSDPPRENPPPVTKASSTTVNGAVVKVRADTTDTKGKTVPADDALTDADFNAGKISFDEKQGVITVVKGPPPVTITIQTIYGAKTKPKDLSAYGRGTTVEDKAAGDVTLGFHESCHRNDYLAYVAANALPTFAGAKDMTVDDYKAEMQRYYDAVEAYRVAMLADSDVKTDEVGSPPKSQH